MEEPPVDDQPRNVRAGSKFGPYRLKRLLGRGGFGQVWAAEDTAMDRVVALKLLKSDYSENESFRQRLYREARAAGRLHDPHVVPIHRCGEIDGQLYIDMRLIEGTDLETVLSEQGPLPPMRAVAVVRQIAAALDAAHTADLIHRDVKPANILLTKDDFACLVDFGLANAASDAKLTSTGVTIGTFAYLAPERLTAGGDVDHRSDVYALTCVLYEALTGSSPYSGDLPALISAHLSAAIPQPSAMRPGIPASFDDVIARGMAKRSDDRYSSAGDLALAARDALKTGDRIQADTIAARARPFGEQTAAVDATLLNSPQQTQTNTGAPPGTAYESSQPRRGSRPPETVSDNPEVFDSPPPVEDALPDVGTARSLPATSSPAGPLIAKTQLPPFHPYADESPEALGIPTAQDAFPVAHESAPQMPNEGARPPHRSFWTVRAKIALTVVVALAIVGASIIAIIVVRYRKMADPELAALLLSPTQVDQTMGATGMKVTASFTSPVDISAQVPEEACQPLSDPGTYSAYQASKWRDLRGQQLHEPGDTGAHSAGQFVIEFSSAGDALAFFADSVQRWRACSNVSYVYRRTGKPDATEEVGPVSDATPGVLTATVKDPTSNGWECHRALQLASAKIVVDVVACGHDHPRAAVDIAHQIAAKIPSSVV